MRAPDDRTDPPPGPGRAVRKPFPAALAAFLEERNILWGELVGGLLVVGCSAALIITLWGTLRDNPLFKSCTFTGTVAAVVGAGLYTLRRWRLQSTSRGLLLVGTLLAPLDLLALALPGTDPGGAAELLVQAASLLVLALLVWRAARFLTPDRAGLLAGAVVATAACQLPMARFLHPGSDGTRLLVFGLLPVGCNLLASAGLL